MFLSHKITCHLTDAFIQSDLQLIRLSRRHTPWSNVELRALLKGLTAVQILSWPHQGSNLHRPCGSKSSSLTATLQAAPDQILCVAITFSLTHTHTHTHTHSHTQTHTHTGRHTHTHRYTQTHRQTHTQTHTQTRRHTHTSAVPIISSSFSLSAIRQAYLTS